MSLSQVVFRVLVVLAASGFGCSSGSLGGDAGESGTDAGAKSDAATPDAGEGGCQLVTLEQVGFDYREDIQTVFSGRLSASLGAGVSDYLVFNFVNYNERIGSMGIGTFSLSEPPNDNRGTCADCVSVFVDQVTPNAVPAQVYFQSAGTMTLTANPRESRLAARVEGLELVEVTIDPATLESMPVPGGGCLRMDTFDVEVKTIPPEWTCSADLYENGTCNCSCGAPDPDCFCDPFLNPECRPEEIQNDCAEGDLCTWRGCVQICDMFATPVVRCPTGQLCSFDEGQQICIPEEGRVNAELLGQECQGLLGFTQYCQVRDTIPAGFCDEFDNLCRAVCARTSTITPACAAGEQCYFQVDFPDGDAFGYCRPN